MTVVAVRACELKERTMPTKPLCRHLVRPIGNLKVTCSDDARKIKYTASCVCKLHGRCLPYWSGPWSKRQVGVESAIYALCHRDDGSSCPEYSPPPLPTSLSESQ